MDMRLALPLWLYRIRPLRWLLRVTVWKWLEREAGVKEQAETFGAPSYSYGKCPDDLLVMTEVTESPYVCCGYCSAGMACRTVKPSLSNKMTSTAHPIRSTGGRPHNNGAYASELRRGAKNAHGVTLNAIAISEIKDRLRAGYAVVVNLQYAQLPSHLKVQGGDFGHSCTLFGFQENEGTENDMVGFYDPLWPQDARGAWAKFVQIKPALWSDGEHSTTTVKGMALAGDYVIYDTEVNSRKKGKAAASAPFFNDWEMKSKRGAFSTSGATVQIMGYRGDSYAVQVQTAQGWSDGVSKPTLVFVAKTKITGIVNDPVHTCPVCPPVPDIDAEIKKAKQEEWDSMIDVFPPRP